MEEINKVLEALSVVERYEDYLFNKSWAKALLAIGVVLPLGVIINMNALLLSSLTGLDAEYLGLFSMLLAVVICFGFVAYAFFGAWKTVKKTEATSSSDSLHGPLIGIAWFISFMLARLAPESLQIVSILWAASLACLLSFAILRLTGSHVQERILLYLGSSLGLASLPLVFLTDYVLAGYLALLAFSGCFILAGVLMQRLATRILDASA